MDRKLRSDSSWALIGLGNPGREYERTRHNVGFHVIDYLYNLLQLEPQFDKYLHSEFAVRSTGEQRVIVAKPLCFMNNSGTAVLQILKCFAIEPQNCLVITDNADLPVGSLRLRLRGSSGATHNGIRSILAYLGHGNFLRLYVGIGLQRPHQSLASYVLGRWDASENEEYHNAFMRSAQMLAQIPHKAIEEIQRDLN